MSGSLLLSATLREIEQVNAGAEPALMERAGAALAQLVRRVLALRSGCVLVLAGPGNNGGDGFVMARHLLAAGKDVRVICASSPERMPPDARRARESFLAAGGQIFPDFLGSNWALVVDAIFGIGLKRPPDGLYAGWIERVNAMDCPILSVDAPSGLDADTGCVIGDAVRATHTLSLIAHKPGLFTGDGPDYAGQCLLDPLGLDLSGYQDGILLTREVCSKAFKPRARNTHKGHFGQAGILGGAQGMTGAALLAARAALYAGAGRVYAGLLAEDALAVDPVQPELMLREPGDLLSLCSVLGVGPGLGTSEVAAQQLQRATAFPGALVLDADALNLLAQTPGLQAVISQRQAPSILTPHPAEAARLLQVTTADIQADRIASCRTLARRFNAHVVLKGAGSVVALADGRWFINTTGNPGLASAGSGDVLTGVMAGLLASGYAADIAVLAAVLLHGAAADELVQGGTGPVGLTAGELIPAVRCLLNRWTGRRP